MISRRPRRVLRSLRIYLFILSVGRKMTPFPETVSDPNIYKVQLCIFDGEFVFSNYHLSD